MLDRPTLTEMAYAIRYRPGDRLAVIQFSGHIMGSEVGEAIEALAERLPTPAGAVSVLCDTREATSLFVLSGDIERTVRAIRGLEARAPVGRGAYLGGRNHAVFIGLVRVLFRMLGTTRRPRSAFTDYDQAVAWLLETP